MDARLRAPISSCIVRPPFRWSGRGGPIGVGPRCPSPDGDRGRSGPSGVSDDPDGRLPLWASGAGALVEEVLAGAVPADHDARDLQVAVLPRQTGAEGAVELLLGHDGHGVLDRGPVGAAGLLDRLR